MSFFKKDQEALIENEFSQLISGFETMAERLRGLNAVCEEEQARIDVEIDKLKNKQDKVRNTNERAKRVAVNIDKFLSID